MHSLPAIFLGSFVVALSGALMPGPMFSVTVREAARDGFWVGPLLILGHGLLELSLVVALVSGLGPVLTKPPLLAAVGLVGGLVLLWIAWGMLRGLPKLTLSLEASREPREGNRVLAGVVLSLANPYWLLWWATVGVSYLALTSGRGWLGAGVFFAGHITADLAWYSLVSAAVHLGRRFLSDRHYRALAGSCALLLLWFGFSFLRSGAAGLLEAW